MKFVDVKNDIAFHKIFGNEKKTKIIISFLNAILKLEGNRRIVKATITNPYQFPRIAGEKASIIDVGVEDKAGRKFIVEMQVANVDGFDKRVQYYTCRDHSLQIERGEQYPLLKPTHFIGILDFNYFDSDTYLSHHIILNQETYEHKLKDIQFSFIELRKFNLEEKDLQTLIDKWIYFIKNAENLELIPSNINDAGLREAYKDANKHNWKKEELLAYDNASIAEQDERGKIVAAVNSGIAKEKVNVVERCWSKNMPIPVIAEIANLTIVEVEAIIKQIESET